ncbi:MAG: sorbitol dehydrogenase [Candidatus Binatia bacterium]|nr:MAG: sorbitol dehydrogenase [Candidatus Binatia bacterium]
MRVARLYDFLDLRIEEEAVPEPGPEDALVRVRACGICSGDVVPWYVRKKAPVVLGHEVSGRIVALGERVSKFRVGQRVFVHHHAPCLECESCRRGEFVQCPVWRASRLVPGGLAEFVLVPARNLEVDTLELPPHVGFEDGALVEPVACVVKSLRRAGSLEGATVLVVGLGVMGLFHVILARHRGAGRIFGADFVAARRRKAEEVGADGTIDASSEDVAEAVRRLTGGRGADVVVVGPGTLEAWDVGFRSAADGGVVVLFMGTEPGRVFPLDAHRFFFREIRLVPSYSCGPYDTREALDLVARGVVRAKDVVTHVFPFEKVAEAYRTAAEDKSAIKTMVVMDDEGPE